MAELLGPGWSMELHLDGLKSLQLFQGGRESPTMPKLFHETSLNRECSPDPMMFLIYDGLRMEQLRGDYDEYSRHPPPLKHIASNSCILATILAVQIQGTIIINTAASSRQRMVLSVLDLCLLDTAPTRAPPPWIILWLLRSEGFFHQKNKDAKRESRLNQGLLKGGETQNERCGHAAGVPRATNQISNE